MGMMVTQVHDMTEIQNEDSGQVEHTRERKSELYFDSPTTFEFNETICHHEKSL
jgi:hypothetical protein